MPTESNRIRQRVKPVPKSGVKVIGKIYNRSTPNSPWNFWVNHTHNFIGPYNEAQITMDELHPGPPWKSGGPFKSLKFRYSYPHELQGIGTYLNWDLRQKYVGGFAPPGNATIGGPDLSNLNSLLNPNSPLFPDLAAQGATAWNKSKPKIQKADLFVDIAEFRDIPRMLRTTANNFHDIWKSMGGNVTGKSMTAKGAADNFLNQQFGWGPFLKEILKLYSIYLTIELQMLKIAKKNGRKHRTRATLVDTISEKRDKSGTGVICEPGILESHFSYYFRSNPTWEVIKRVKTLGFTSGQFTFYLPEFDMENLQQYQSQWSGIKRQIAIYGLRINPSNVYNATPWSWLIDWFANVGDHMDNLSSIYQDSIVCHYLYLMQTDLVEYEFIQTLPFIQSPPLSLSWLKSYESKQRSANESPYGMSLSWANLSSRQLAILGALGITRTRPTGA